MDDLDAIYARAWSLHQANQLAEAEALYRDLLRSAPGMAVARIKLGLLLQTQNRREEAVECYQRSLQGDRQDAEAYCYWGKLLGDQGRLAEAAEKFSQAAAAAPDWAEAHYNRAVALQMLGHDTEAIGAYTCALALNHHLVTAYNNLGLLLFRRGRHAAASDYYRRAVEMKPDYAQAYSNLGAALLQQGQWSEALEALNHCLRLEPDSSDAHLNRAMLHLLHGEFASGWSDYAWYPRRNASAHAQFSQPMWDGSAFPNRTLLVHAEQGLGDTLHFVRYLRLARQRGGRVVFAAPTALLPLLAASRIEDVVAIDGPIPRFDLRLPLTQLPVVLETTFENMPADVPYLHADPKLVETWRGQFSDVPGLKIGIAWQGSPNYTHDRLRSIPLANYAPLLQVPGTRWYSLQKQHGTEQLPAIAGKHNIVDLGPRLDESSGAFMDTAAVVKLLDLVITSDSALAHLAGALGVPTWVALSKVPDWRWFLQRDDSPWYPTLRLFRQTKSGDWSGVFERMAVALAELTNRR